MTDYLYSLSIAEQTRSFLFSLGFGFIMGFLYDIVRIIRICISAKKASFIISDILYSVILCISTFLFLLTVNEGEVRFYLILGEAAGFGVWYFSLGVLLYSVSGKIIAFLKRAARAVFRAVSFPFRWIFGKIGKLFNKIFKKSRKKSKNLKNKSNFLLKVNKLLLYNLNIKKAPADGGLSEEREA